MWKNFSAIDYSATKHVVKKISEFTVCKELVDKNYGIKPKNCV